MSRKLDLLCWPMVSEGAGGKPLGEKFPRSNSLSNYPHGRNGLPQHMLLKMAVIVQHYVRRDLSTSRLTR